MAPRERNHRAAHSPPSPQVVRGGRAVLRNVPGMPPDDALPLVLRALDDVDVVSRTLRDAGATTWSSEAADRFRAALEEAHDRVHHVRVAVDRTVQPVAAAGLATGGL